MGGLVETTVDERNVALLRLNRPEARNALSAEMRAEILADLERLDADPEVRCIVLAGSEKVFAAGADIRAMAERPLDAPPDPAGMVFWKGIAATDELLPTEIQLTPEQQEYNWNARIFQERQQNLTMACEIPVLIEQRAYEIGRLIRGLMKS